MHQRQWARRRAQLRAITTALLALLVAGALTMCRGEDSGANDAGADSAAGAVPASTGDSRGSTLASNDDDGTATNAGPRDENGAGGTRADAVDGPTAGPFTLAFSNESRCWFVPCDCKEKMSGGLPRRATFLKSLNTEGRLIVDLGNVACGDSTIGRHIHGYMAAAMTRMGYDALNLGSSELELIVGGGVTIPASEASHIPWVSASVGADRLTDIEPFRVFERRGVRFGVTAIVETDAPRASRALDGDGLAKTWPALRDACDVAILLADVTEARARELAQAYPGFAFILFAAAPADGQPRNQAPVGLGPGGGAPFVARVGARGLYQGVIDFRLERGAPVDVRGKFVELNDSYADDPSMRSLVDRLGARWPTAIPDDYEVDDNIYTGAAECAQCHEEAVLAWQGSRHARAFTTLKETTRTERAHRNPRCLTCHTLGFNQPEFGGYATVYQVPEHLRGITCGNCHGRASLHADPFADSDEERASLTTRNARAVCTNCHDQHNDPDFDFDEAWEHIKH